MQVSNSKSVAPYDYYQKQQSSYARNSSGTYSNDNPQQNSNSISTNERYSVNEKDDASGNQSYSSPSTSTSQDWKTMKDL